MDLAERCVVGCLNDFRQALGELLVSRAPNGLFGLNVDNQWLHQPRCRITTACSGRRCAPLLMLGVRLLIIERKEIDHEDFRTEAEGSSADYIWQASDACSSTL
jgi:hypothetical protein